MYVLQQILASSDRECSGQLYGQYISVPFFVKRAQLSLRNASLASSLSHVAPHHFKMEGLHTLKDLLKTGDWMTKVDLRDAYFMIPIHSSDRSLQTRIVINS